LLATPTIAPIFHREDRIAPTTRVHSKPHNSCEGQGSSSACWACVERPVNRSCVHSVERCAAAQTPCAKRIRDWHAAATSAETCGDTGCQFRREQFALDQRTKMQPAMCSAHAWPHRSAPRALPSL
jgi:hypothetical protein